jgi:hypothetical protein
VATKKMDIYSNIVAVQALQTVIDAYTTAEVQIGVSLFDKVGLLLHKVEYDLWVSSMAQLRDVSNLYQVGLVSSTNVNGGNFTMLNPDVIDTLILIPVQDEAPTARIVYQSPVTRDFTGLPGGGILIAPRPLYVALDTNGFSAVAATIARITFSLVSLSDAEYLELLQTRRGFST